MNAVRIATIACWIISALVLAGLVIWFLTGSLFGVLTDGMGNWSIGFGIENLSGSFETDSTYNVNTEGIDSIKINWVAGEVTVRPHDGDDIQIIESAQRTLRDNEKLNYSISGNTLEIRFRERGLRSVRIPSKRLEVLVPHFLSESVDTLAIDSVSGDINVQDINASRLDLDSTSGNITIAGVYDSAKLNTISGRITLIPGTRAGILDIVTVSGRVEVSGTFEKVSTNTVSGNVSFTSRQVPSSLKADSVSGNINITLPDDATLSVSHSSVSGKMSSDLPMTMEGKGAQFIISTVSGRTRIEALG